MKASYFRFLMPCTLALFLIQGCASFSQRYNQAGTQIDEKQVQSKLIEANSSLDTVNESASAFYSQLGPVLEEIKQLSDQPRWKEFEQILLEFPALRDPDNEIEITDEMESRLAEWSKRWKTSWQEQLVSYHDLIDKCIILEARKLAVKERLLTVQAKYVAAVQMEVYAGREKEGKEIFAVVELLDGTKAELDSYQADDFGLYRPK